MVWKKVVNSDAGDADHFGGNDVDKISDLLSGVSAVDTVDMNSDFTYRDARLKLRNPANTQTLTFKNPAITASYDTSINAPYNYLIYNDGVSNYAKNGVTGAIESNNSLAHVVIQYALDALATTGGLIHIVTGTYNISAELVVPQHSGKSITIRGEGWRNTLIKWTGGLDSALYCLKSYSTDAVGWQILTLKDIQIWGGSSTTDRKVHVLKLGREVDTAVAHYDFYNVRVSNGISAQIVANYVQDSHWYNFYCESVGGTPTPIIDLAITQSSHMNLVACLAGTVTVDQSRINVLGGTMTNLELKAINNYTPTFIGVWFDPTTGGFTHQIQIGTTGIVTGAIFDNCTFSSDTTTPATDRYIYVNDSRNVFIRNPNFSSASTVATYIEITSAAEGTVIDFPYQTSLLSKITDNGVGTVIRSPHYLNNITINNPAGTLGANLTDNHTANKIQLANSALHLVNSVYSSSASAKWKLSTRNAANSADVTRFQAGNLANVGLSPLVSFENMTFSGGVSVVPFIKAGVPSDTDFLNPVSGLVALDTTNNTLYARIGTVWTILGSKSVSGGVPKSISHFEPRASPGAVNTLLYISITNHILNATENIVDLIHDYAFTITRYRIMVHSNTKDGNTIVAFRDDGADVTGTVFTIAAGVTGELDSGALSVAVAAGSRINWKIDQTASTTGSIVVWGVVEIEYLLQ